MPFSGKAGRHVIPYLLSQGHQILNLDLVDFPDKSANVYTLKCDLTDSGQVFNALTTLFDMGEYGKKDDPKERVNGGYLGSPAMVIHFAAYARVSKPFERIFGYEKWFHELIELGSWI